MKRYICELIGTLILVLFGCGVAVFTDADLITTSLAFGLSIIVIFYSIGGISGCHLNPAVSFAFYLNGKMSGKEFIKYVTSQIIGAIIGAILIAIIINNVSNLGDYRQTSMGVNSYGGFGINMLGAFIVETILTFVFVLTILCVTKNNKYSNIAGFVIGLTLTLVHLLGINLTGTSVNPARSIGPALVLGFDSIKQLWLFILAPLFGSALASITEKNLFNEKKK